MQFEKHGYAKTFLTDTPPDNHDKYMKFNIGQSVTPYKMLWSMMMVTMT